ncbi:MAG: hypothetical protein Q4G02_04155, partial [bacterium]|nr:hypothetical protein [bacterium]
SLKLGKQFMSADYSRTLLCQEQQCAWQLPNDASNWHFAPESLQKQEIWQWRNETGEDLTLQVQLVLNNTYKDLYDPVLRLKISRLENEQAQTLLDGNLRWLAQLTPTFSETLQASASCQLQLDFYHTEIDVLLGQKIKNSNFNYSWRLKVITVQATQASTSAQLQLESEASAGGDEIKPFSPPALAAITAIASADEVIEPAAKTATGGAALINFDSVTTSAENLPFAILEEPNLEETVFVLGEATMSAPANPSSRFYFSSWFWLILLVGLGFWWYYAARKFFKK